jgi:hypothetical protein
MKGITDTEVASEGVCLNLFMQSIYYSLRLFLLNLREAYQRTAAEYHRAKAAAEEALTKARAAAGQEGEEGEGQGGGGGWGVV